MCEDNKYIRFDWAIKHLLRDKANFSVLEGLITVLTGESVRIVEILESEGNQESSDDKFNRVDIKARNDKGHIIIVEVQLTRQFYYMQRILYGVAKTITEHIALGDKYDKISKVYSISILYCDMSVGEDYIYRGKTMFTGMFSKDKLTAITKDRESGRVTKVLPEDIFPEYFLIRVNNYDKVPENAVDEWVEYLKTGKIKENTTAPGLREAREKLLYLKMSDSERRAYDRHVDSIMVQNDSIDTAITEGYIKGRTEGERAMALNIARRMLESGLGIAEAARITGLSESEILFNGGSDK